MSEAPTRRTRVLPIVAVLAAAAAVVFVVMSQRPNDAPPRPARTDRGSLSSRREARIHVAHASLRVRAHSAIEWRGALVVLRRGAVHVEVDPRPHAPFRVRTTRFDVDVTGTSFDVDTESVRVERGSVRVSARDGRLLADLSAGERWPQEQARQERTARASTEVPPPARPTPSRRERFEAAVRLERTRPERALADYRRLEQEGGPWASNAMFARGRLLDELGRRDESRALLTRYILLHPNGANAEDARDLLAP